MWKPALLILIRPRQIMTELLGTDLKIRTVLIWLFWVGLLRGMLEVVWLFAMSHRLNELGLLARHSSWWTLESGPFVLANVLTAYFRWALYSVVVFAAFRWFRVTVDFAQVLRICGAMMGLYVLTILVNFLHVAFDLPLLQFQLAELYTPSFGVGQGVSAVLVLWVIVTFGRLRGLDRFSSCLSAMLVVLVERVTYFLAARGYFHLPVVGLLPYKSLVLIANHLTTVVSVLGVIMCLWIGFKLNGRQKAPL